MCYLGKLRPSIPRDIKQEFRVSAGLKGLKNVNLQTLQVSGKS